LRVSPHQPPYFQNVIQETFSIADDVNHRSMATLPQGTTLSSLCTPVFCFSLTNEAREKPRFYPRLLTLVFMMPDLAGERVRSELQETLQFAGRDQVGAAVSLEVGADSGVVRARSNDFDHSAFADGELRVVHAVTTLGIGEVVTQFRSFDSTFDLLLS